MRTTFSMFLLLSGIGCAGGAPQVFDDESASALALPNDNRTPAGTLRDGVLEVDLEARLGRWEGEASNLSAPESARSVLEVFGFAESGGPVTIPGPLIRVPEGTEVRLRVTNSLPSGQSLGLPAPGLRYEGITADAEPTLVVHGIRAGTMPDDTVGIGSGETREVTFTANVPGTFLYWATPSSRPITSWTGRDATLAGAIVVDPAGAAPDPDERIFVITMLDMFPDSADSGSQDEYFRRAINGLSWPATERFQYNVGDTVRWRWVNASFEHHPMHLHGFHYRVLSKGNGTSDVSYSTDEVRTVVTETMDPGSTFTMEWVPEREGNWILHCHFIDHVVPTIERDAAARTADMLDPEQHALSAMAGLVVGISVSGDSSSSARTPQRRLRLAAHESHSDDGALSRGFSILDEMASPPAIVSAPGPPLVLTRGEMTEITVINRLSEPTTIHWHGLELESVFDGVAGWSRTRGRVAPLIAPGDSFSVRIAPPRVGTFIYHTHMDATNQLAEGMAGAFIVVEPGETFDPEIDRIFLIAGQPEGDYPLTMNGQDTPEPSDFRAGTSYRLRFIHISRGTDAEVELSRGRDAATWTRIAKDGADLPPALMAPDRARFRTNTGETFDFLWTPAEPGDFELTIRYSRLFAGTPGLIRQTMRVR